MYETDEQLYKRFLKDEDEACFRELYIRHHEALTLFLYGYTGNMEDAEELMLDAFSRASMPRSAFLAKSSFRTWLFSIGRNLACKYMRKTKAQPTDPDEMPLSTQENPEMVLLKKEQSRQVFAALQELPEDYARILYLLYFEEMDHEEAAKIMKKSKKQVYNLATRARGALKEKLEGRL